MGLKDHMSARSPHDSSYLLGTPTAITSYDCAVFSMKYEHELFDVFFFCIE